MSPRTTYADVVAAGPPWYGLLGSDDTNRLVRGWGGGTGGVHLTLSHMWGFGPRSVEVETSADAAEPSAELDQLALLRWFSWRAMVADMATATFPMRFEVQRDVLSIPVDGALTEFVMLGDEHSRVGYATVGARRINLDVRGVPLVEIVLGSVDPNTYKRDE